MKRITLWVLSTLTVVVLLFGYKTSTAGPLASSGPQATSSQHAYTATAGGATTAPATTAPTPSTPATGSGSTRKKKSAKATPSPTPTPSAKAPATTTVTGSVAETRWGPVQVQLQISGRAISQVSVLQYPAGNPMDNEINAYALPILTQETVDAQSAQIDMISGATVTSDGYVRSLQSAIDKAGL